MLASNKKFSYMDRKLVVSSNICGSNFLLQTSILVEELDICKK